MRHPGGLTSVHHAGRIVLFFDDFAVLAGFAELRSPCKVSLSRGFAADPNPSSFYSGMVISIFLAVDRCHVRGVSIEIRPSDSKLLPVCIDPFPEGFSGSPTLRPCRTIDAHNIRRKPVAIASTEATSMIGPLVGRLQAACNRLAIVIAERAGYAGR